ncbi:MAG: protein kinase [Pirellulales bacterium]
MNERDIFEKAIEIQDRKQRDAFLDQACGADAALRQRLDELLASHDQASGFLKVPVVDQAPPTKLSGPHPTLELLPTGQALGNETADAANDDDHDDDAVGTTDLSFLQPSSKASSIGRLGHYEILQILGQGAFGIVFKAFDERLHRHVAIKAMNPQLASTSPPRKRFLREARSVAAIKHENIVQVYAVEEQPLPYLAMEFVDGQTLAQKLETAGPLDASEILYLGRQMAAGLAAAHDKGLIHRDIKPGNILLEAGAEQKVKITDFGLARAADDATMTRTGTIAGTPMFMSPEQAMGQTLDHRSDLFSLGSVMYQMASGRPPFRGANAIAVLKRVVDEAPRPIQDILPEVPEWLCAIIEKLHAKNPDERYHSAKEVADVLARCQNELQVNGKVTCVALPSQAARASSSQSTSVSATPVPALPKVERPSGQPASRGPLIFAATAALLIVGFTLLELTGISNFFRKPAGNDQTVASGETQRQTQDSTVQTASATGWHGWPVDAPKPAIAPFDAEQAKKHQEEWAAYLKVPVEYTNSIGMKFRLIPPGEFTMGSSSKEINDEIAERKQDVEFWRGAIQSEGPQRLVRISHPFYLGVHETTVRDFAQFTNATNYLTGPERDPSGQSALGINASGSWQSATGFSWKNVGYEQDPLQPVINVDCKDATAFCEWLGGGRVDAAWLPSEAEWEMAVRAGSAARFFWGTESLEAPNYSWFGMDAAAKPQVVGLKQSNPFGLKDVYGNVWEVCGRFLGRHAAIIDGADGLETSYGSVMRGGAFWDTSPHTHYSAERLSYGCARLRNLGFRIALSIDTVRQELSVTGPAIPKSPTTDLAGSKTAPAISNADPDRAVAEWVLSLPGDRSIKINGSEQAITRHEDLPTSSFQVEVIIAKDAENVTDDDLRRLADLPGLRTIDLVSKIDLFPHITDQGIRNLTHGTSAATIQNLGFYGRLPKVSDDSIPHLNRLVHLQACFLPAAFTDVGLQHLSLQELGTLHLPRSNASPGGFAKISERLPVLADLNLSYIDLSKSDLATFRQTQIHTLQLSTCNLTPQAFRTLENNTALKVLGIPNNSGLTDSALSVLPTLRNLTHLNLAESNSLTDVCFDTLSKMQSLVWLDLRRCEKLTEAGVRKLQAALPKCKIESDFSNVAAIDFAAERKAAEWVLKVGGTPYLADEQGNPFTVVNGKLPETSFTVIGVSIFNQQSVKDEDLAVLAECRQLQNVTLSGSSEVTDAGVRQLDFKAPLNHLNLDGTQITDASISLIVENQSLRESLREIAIRGTRVTDEGLRRLAEHRRLVGLWIGSKGITRQGIQAAVMGNPELNVLQFSSESPDDALHGLAKHPRLFQLNIAARQLDDPAVEIIRSLPNFGSLAIGEMDDDTFNRVAKLSQLKELMIQTGNFSSGSLGKLAVLPALSHLEARGEGIDDACLAALEKWPALKFVILHSMTRVTEAALTRFRQSRPDVHLNIDGKDYPATK